MSDNELVTTSPTQSTFQDPGLPEHKLRMGDTDPVAAKRSERIVVGLFAVSILGTIGSLLAYFLVVPNETTDSVRNANIALGVTLFLSLMGIGLAAIHWAKSLMSDHEVVEERHLTASDAPTREAALTKLNDGVKDANIGRRTVLKGSVITALGLFPVDDRSSADWICWKRLGCVKVPPHNVEERNPTHHRPSGSSSQGI